MDVDDIDEAEEVHEIIRRELNSNQDPEAETETLKYTFLMTQQRVAKELLTKRVIEEGWNRWRIRNHNGTPI